ncbi:MAG: FKBP-type peptidyl-prolyl cis-trans isomerase [Tidjanibacter sp.]|nr:FKBP-type peptidyl-prolyl cis-trans isomerase [Tidjanibacter sp.]
MKKVLFVIAAIAALTSCNSGSKSLKTEIDSVSYGVGYDLGLFLNQRNQVMENTLDYDQVINAILDLRDGKEKMGEEEIYAYLNEYFSIRIPAKKLEAELAYLSKIEQQKNVQKTESGLLYEVLAEGSEVKPSIEDVVRVTYEGKLKDGTIFDSSYQRADTVEFPLNGVIEGWGEGLQLIGEGGKIHLWIPSELGYGVNGAGQQIGPNEPLFFEVNLIEVVKAE